MSNYGYARVSSKDQNLQRQIISLEDFGVKRIFCDKESGKDFNRPQYKHLLKTCKKGDLIVIKSIDRLGRNYDEILKEWRFITKEKRVDIVVLDMPLLDTRQNNDNLTQTFVADLVLQILSYVAQTERENIRQRQKEGIEAARNRGVKFGRPHKDIPYTFYIAKDRYLSKVVSSRVAAKECGIPHTTFMRWVKNNK